MTRFWSAVAVMLSIACASEEGALETGSRGTGAQLEPSGSSPLLKEVTEATGLDFVHDNGMSGQMHFVEMTGAGGGLLDYDGDGDLDLYLVQGGPFSVPLPSPDGYPGAGDRLLRNDLVVTGAGTRSFRFVDVTEASGLVSTGYGMGVATGDIDNDGDVDLYVTNWGKNQLWRNEGDGTFADATQPGVSDDPRWSTSAAFVDFDRDGWLDLVVANYVDYRLVNDHPCFATMSGRRDYCGSQAYDPEPDRLLRNLGDGTFEDVTLRIGMAVTFGAGLGVTVADFDLDGWPDVYVANDGMENQLWINQGGDRFVNRAVSAGAAVSLLGAPEASMGVVAADFDGDGDDDLFMTHLNGESNTLYENLGSGLFADRTRRFGLGQASWPYTAFGTGALDVDLDGWLDIFIVNGEVRVVPEQADAGDPLPLRQPNQLFRNLGDGRFEEVPGWGGPTGSLSEVSRGSAFGDVDNDGDTDVLVLNNNGPARLFLSEGSDRANWVGMRLLGPPGRNALGARVALVRAGGSTLWGRSHTDGSFGSAHDPRVVFGLGGDPVTGTVRVEWPDGHVEEWVGLTSGEYHTLRQGAGNPRP